MISVITLTFNNYDQLLETLNSTKNISSIESIVVNGGQCNQTSRFLKTYPGKYISEPDQGISDGFNKGLHLAKGDAVTFLNSGDKLIDENYYPIAETTLNRDPTIDFVYADILFNDSIAGQLTITSGRDLPDMTYQHPTLIVRKKIFDQIGSFDINLKSAMDLDFIYRLKKNGFKGFYYQRPVVEMDGHGISSKNDFLFLKEKFLVILKNRDFRLFTLTTCMRLMISFCIRRVLIALGLSRIVSIYRRYKHS